jgi:hypothetical protein
MMLLVLRVENETSLDTFVASMREREPQEGMPLVPQGAEIVGLFKSPTKWCDPSDGHRGKKTDAGWTRGLKYGWWVCGKCKKPSWAWSQSLNAVLGAAHNLFESTKESK